MAVILLITENPVLRPTLRDLLQLEGHAIIATAHCHEAQIVLENVSGVDLLALDCTTFETTKQTLLQKLRENHQYFMLPTLLFSVKPSAPLTYSPALSSAQAFLVPPITVQAFKEQIQRLLSPCSAFSPAAAV